MVRHQRKLHREYPFLKNCFGRGLRYCRCPEILKPLCRKVRLTDLRSPIPLRAGSGERPFGYTAVDNRVFRPWAISGGEPNDAVKMTYAFLISKADSVTRWVYAKPEKRAEERGIPPRTLVEHEKALERMGLILRVPYLKIRRDSGKRFRTIILLDLPRWFANLCDESESAADDAWARNESDRLSKHLVPGEIRDAQIDESVEDLACDAWTAE